MNGGKNHFLDAEKLKLGFESLDKRIRYWRATGGYTKSKEELLKEKEDLLKTAKEMDIMDLKILYYIKNCSYVFRSSLLQSLEALYQAECAYKEALKTSKK